MKKLKKIIKIIIAIIIFYIILIKIDDKRTMEYKQSRNFIVNYGYMNLKGEWVIEPTLQILENKYGWELDPTFYCDTTIFKQNNKVGLINKKGEVVKYLNNKYDHHYYYENFYIYYYYNDCFWIKNKNNQWGLIDKAGNFIIQSIYNGIKFIEDKYVGVKLNDKWGYVDYDGNYIIEPKYDNIYPFSDDGYALVEEIVSESSGEKLTKGFIIDSKGNIISELNNDMKIVKDKMYEFIDGTWQIADEPQYSDINSISDDIFRTKVNANDEFYTFINDKGETLFTISTDVLKEEVKFSEGLCWTKDGYINKSGELVYKTDKYHTDFINGTAFVGNSLIDLEGNTILQIDDDKEFISYAPVSEDSLIPVAINRTKDKLFYKPGTISGINYFERKFRH